jgi:hypothetical protein
VTGWSIYEDSRNAERVVNVCASQDVYILDYLRKRDLNQTAHLFVQEAKLTQARPIGESEKGFPSCDLCPPCFPLGVALSLTPVCLASAAIDAPSGFLCEWWSVFWDIFIARTNPRYSDAAAQYVEVGVELPSALQRLATSSGSLFLEEKPVLSAAFRLARLYVSAVQFQKQKQLHLHERNAAMQMQYQQMQQQQQQQVALVGFFFSPRCCTLVLSTWTPAPLSFVPLRLFRWNLRHATWRTTIRSVLFGMQNRTLGPHVAPIIGGSMCHALLRLARRGFRHAAGTRPVPAGTGCSDACDERRSPKHVPGSSKLAMSLSAHRSYHRIIGVTWPSADGASASVRLFFQRAMPVLRRALRGPWHFCRTAKKGKQEATRDPFAIDAPFAFVRHHRCVSGSASRCCSVRWGLLPWT